MKSILCQKSVLTIIICIFIASWNSGCMPPSSLLSGTSAPLSNPTKDRTFYVDAANGDDSNDGQSPSTAWKSISKVNSSSLNPGDKILLNRGNKWTGTTLIAQSGITYADYGNGAKPILDGNHIVDGVVVNNKTQVNFTNLEIQNVYDFGILFDNCSYCTATELEVHDCGNDCLSFIPSGTDNSVIQGKIFNTTQRDGTSVSSGIEFADGGSGHIVDGTEIYNTKSAAITIHNHDYGGGKTTQMPSGIFIKNVYLHDNQGMGGLVFRQADSGPVNITYQNCRIENNALDGIFISKNANYSSYPDGATIFGCIIQNNSQNQMHVGGGSNISIGYNLFNVQTININPALNIYNSQNVVVYNNTIYTNQNSNYTGLVELGGATTNNFKFKNNIVAANSSSAMPYMVQLASDCGTSGMEIDYNLYSYSDSGLRWTWLGSNLTLANWKTVSGQDANSPSPADPLFVDAGNNDFHLLSTSPAINRGVDVGLLYTGNAPDLGAFPVSQP